MKTNNIKIIIAAVLNFIVCLTLLFTLVPSSIPYFTNLDGNIAVIGSKWFMLWGTILPLVFAGFFVFSKKESVEF